MDDQENVVNDYLIRKEMGESLKGYREKAGLTQVQLAQKMFTSTSTVQNWEKGFLIGSRQDLEKLFEVLDIPKNVQLKMILTFAKKYEYSPEEIYEIYKKSLEENDSYLRINFRFPYLYEFEAVVERDAVDRIYFGQRPEANGSRLATILSLRMKALQITIGYIKDPHIEKEDLFDVDPLKIVDAVAKEYAIALAAQEEFWSELNFREVDFRLRDDGMTSVPYGAMLEKNEEYSINSVRFCFKRTRKSSKETIEKALKEMEKEYSELEVLYIALLENLWNSHEKGIEKTYVYDPILKSVFKKITILGTKEFFFMPIQKSDITDILKNEKLIKTETIDMLYNGIEGVLFMRFRDFVSRDLAAKTKKEAVLVVGDTEKSKATFDESIEKCMNNEALKKICKKLDQARINSH